MSSSSSSGSSARTISGFSSSISGREQSPVGSRPKNEGVGPGFWEVVALPYFYLDSESPLVEEARVPANPGSGRVGKCASVMTMKKVQSVARDFFVGPTVRMVAPRPSDRACCPPAGYVTIYADCLKCGLRLPLPEAYVEFLRQYELALGQIMPNSFKNLVGLGVEVRELGVNLDLGVILKFYQPKHTAGSGGWYYLAPQQGFRVQTASKIANWSRRFFYCRAEDIGAPDIPWNFGKLESYDSALGTMPWESVISSRGMVKRVYTEAEMADAGLSPCDPAQAVKGETSRFVLLLVTHIFVMCFVSLLRLFSCLSVRLLQNIKRKNAEASTDVEAGQSPPPTRQDKPKRLKSVAQAEAGKETSASELPARKGKEVEGKARASSGKKILVAAEKTVVGSPAAAGGRSLASPIVSPRHFPEDAEVVLADAANASATLSNVAESFSAMTSGLHHFVEEGVKACGRLKKALARAKAGEEEARKEAAAAKEAARDADVLRAAAEGEAEVAKAEKASLEEEVARQNALAMATQADLVKAVADRIFGSDHFSGLVADAASLMNQATINSVLDDVAAQHPSLEKAKYGYAEVDEEALLLDYARLISKKAPRLPIIKALTSSSTILTPEAVMNCRVDRDKKLDRLLAQVELEDEEVPQQGDDEEITELVQQHEPEVLGTDAAASSGRAGDSPQNEEAQGAVS